MRKKKTQQDTHDWVRPFDDPSAPADCPAGGEKEREREEE